MRKFVLFCLVGGGICLVDNGLQEHGSPDPLSGLGWLCLILALLVPMVRFAVRRLRVCCREITDCIRIARRGVLNPIQVRQEFIDTMGRDPTIAEVHDLHEMIESEYHQAMQKLVIFAGIVLGGAWFFHRTSHHTSPATPLSNVTALQGRR